MLTKMWNWLKSWFVSEPEPEELTKANEARVAKGKKPLTRREYNESYNDYYARPASQSGMSVSDFLIGYTVASMFHRETEAKPQEQSQHSWESHTAGTYKDEVRHSPGIDVETRTYDPPIVPRVYEAPVMAEESRSSYSSGGGGWSSSSDSSSYSSSSSSDYSSSSSSDSSSSSYSSSSTD